MRNRKRICVVTGARAEYGLLYWTMLEIKKSRSFDLQTIVTGMHLEKEFGNTYKQIEKDGFRIDYRVDMQLKSDGELAIAKSIGIATIGFAKAFVQLKPDLILLLGDRFELLAAASAATIFKIPIAHCHGGENTEGVIDEPIRHSLTKMSHLHFVATKPARQRVIQLGENPKRVFLSGAFGIDNIKKLTLWSRKQLQQKLKFQNKQRLVLVTFHPVTLEFNSAKKQFLELLAALDQVENCFIVLTKANADTHGRVINRLIDRYAKRRISQVAAFTSMGQVGYLSVLKHADVVVGNSSSGIIEAPSFHTPCVNIGDRQLGRLKSAGTIDCLPRSKDILKAINKALSANFRNKIHKIKNPYDHGSASKKVLTVLEKTNYQDLLKKKFYNLKITAGLR